jgi:hypothetical protein
MEASGSRPLREKQELKIHRGDFPRLAEALPEESGCPERKSNLTTILIPKYDGPI